MRKYYIKTQVPEEKRTLFGKKTVYREKIVQVDKATWEQYRALRQEAPRKEEKEDGFTLEEMIFYDEIFDDDW